jgi:hypothetical protein
VYTPQPHNLNVAVSLRGTPPSRALRSSFSSPPSVNQFSRFCPDFSHFSFNFSFSFHPCPLCVLCDLCVNSETPQSPYSKPEKMRPLPEDQQLKPENCLKIQLPSASEPFAAPQNPVHHVNPVTPNPPPFPPIQTETPKTFGHFNCSALFRFVPPKFFFLVRCVAFLQ